MPTFTASDGTTFEDRRAYRRYEFELSYTFRNQSGGEDLLSLRKVNEQTVGILIAFVTIV